MASPPTDQAEHLLLGAAGESFVAVHLLRHGLNPTPFAVDSGVDLSADRAVQDRQAFAAPGGVPWTMP
jgi:hypothetical protein